MANYGTHPVRTFVWLDAQGQSWQSDDPGTAARSARGPVWVHVRDRDSARIELAGTCAPLPGARVSVAALLLVAGRLGGQLRAMRLGQERQFRTDEQAWLRKELPRQLRPKAAEMFEQRFGWKPSVPKLADWAKRHRIRLARGRNTTLFQKGHSGTRTVPLYSTRLQDGGSGSGPTMLIKIPEPSPYASQVGQRTRWVPMGPYVWKRAGRKIPPKHFIVHLDGDPANNALENLDCIPKGALAMLNNRATPPRGDKELEPARIRLAQTIDLLNKATREAERRADA